jgi:hypothetical protein
VNSEFTKVQTYADAGGDQASLLIHSLTVADDDLIEGLIYTFKFRSANTVGWSDNTELLRVGLSDIVAAPENLASNFTLATATTLVMTWDEVADDELITDGYSLELL